MSNKNLSILLLLLGVGAWYYTKQKSGGSDSSADASGGGSSKPTYDPSKDVAEAPSSVEEAAQTKEIVKTIDIDEPAAPQVLIPDSSGTFQTNMV